MVRGCCCVLIFNVPTDESGNITNFFRINETLPTILDLQKQGAKVIIIAHKEEGSLDKVAEYLKTKIDNFSFNSEENKQVHLLENIRIDKREKSKDVSEREELGKSCLCWGITISTKPSRPHTATMPLSLLSQNFITQKKNV
jgi:3-phosphoglycerate kinase